MPCTPGMRVRQGKTSGSGCHVRCAHRAMVQEYRLARDAWEQRREDVAIGYATEEREYATWAGDPAPTFGDWLRTRWRRQEPPDDDPA